jgi:hypothetical protein
VVWHVLELRAVIYLQEFKSIEELKPLVQRFQIWKVRNGKKGQIGGQQLRLWEGLHTRNASDCQTCKKWEVLQIPPHPASNKFVALSNGNPFQIGWQAPFRKRLNFWTVNYIQILKRREEYVHLVRQ